MSLLFIRKIWVHLSNPVPMRLNLADLQEAIQIGKNLQDLTFNVAVHALLEDEIQTFGSTEFVGWRHFLNQDFAVSMQPYLFSIHSYFFCIWYAVILILIIPILSMQMIHDISLLNPDVCNC